MKLARLWQWEEGQKPEGLRLRVVGLSEYDGEEGSVYLGNLESKSYPAGTLRPDLADPVTRDGLPRTAKAAWGGKCALYAYPNDDGSWSIYQDTMPGGWRIATGATEDEAWLAAVTAAPEGEAPAGRISDALHPAGTATAASTPEPPPTISAGIVINGVPLTVGQSLTVGVAIATMLVELSDPDLLGPDKRDLRDAYVARCQELQALIAMNNERGVQ